MRVIRIENYGEADTLQLVDEKDPSPSPGEITINVSYAAVGLVDVLLRRGVINVPTPFIPGVEVTEYVREVGSNVNGLKSGQPVAAMLYENMRGYAEQVKVKVNMAIALDDILSDKLTLASAAAGLGNLKTAYVILTEIAPINEEDTILIYGVTGGLGGAVSQVANAVGVGKVLGVSRSKVDSNFAQKMGFEPIQTDELEDRVFSLTNNRGVDLIIDPVGGKIRSQSLKLLKPLGRLIVVGDASGAGDVLLSSEKLWHGNIGAIGFQLGTYASLKPERTAMAAKKVLELVAEGKINADPADSLPLAEASKAHRRLEEGEVDGKLILEITQK